MPIDINKDDIHIAMEKLIARENSLTRLESILKLGSWEIDLKSNKSIWSEQSFQIYGLDSKNTQPTLELFLSMVVPEDLDKVNQVIAEAMKNPHVQTLGCRIKKANGEIRDLLLNAQVVFDLDNKPITLIGSTQDVTEQMDALREAHELSELIKYSSNEIYIVEEDTYHYLYANDGAIKALGYSLEELFNMSVYDTNPELEIERVSMLKQELNHKDKVITRTLHKRKDGSTYHVHSLIHPITYKNKKAYVIFDTDISKQVEDELRFQEQSKQLHHQAHHDTLTNLPNRTLFQDRLSQAIIYSKRHNKSFALLFIDLDQFKRINDSLGHHIGDELLIEASSRLQESIREEDTLARLGGDEFTIILKNIHSIQDVSSIAEKIVTSMKQAFRLKNHNLFISSSIGISLYPDDSTSAHDLLKFSDTAMYKAKDEGRDNYQFYSSDMTVVAFEKVIMESSLRIAIKEEQFVVYFQPQYNAIKNQIVGMEALVRWQHPQIGLVPPGKFIPLAEESGLIIEIDRIVMKKAMQHFSQWYKEGLQPGKLSLNLAMKQLSEKDFISKLLYTMNDLNFSPSWLTLEVTEGQIMDNPKASIEKLNQISDIGIELAIDDFGTGYSSLAYLKKLPLNKLKIDQSFVKDVDVDEDDGAITKAIIALGKSLNMDLIAEGVESIDQKEFLLKNGCSCIQGYLYSKPLPAQEMRLLLID